MGNNIGAHIAVVTVTYGMRWHLLRQVLSAAFGQGVESAVVVDNASQDAVLLNAKNEFGDKVHVVSLLENTGSAKGYATGMLTAVQQFSPEFLWLLDDDNCPLPQSLHRLLVAYERLGSHDSNVLLSLRKDRNEYMLSALTGKPLIYRRNAFQGFHLSDILARFFNKILCSDPERNGRAKFNGDLVPISYAPYGGLFLHKNWMGRVGVPDERFFLYCDDHEYTYRIVKSGGSIYLCVNSEIQDIETSWNLRNSRVPHFFSDSSDPVKLMYSLRNRVYFEIQSLTDNKISYFANMYVYLSYLVLKSLYLHVSVTFVMKRTSLILQAIRNGLAGRLGKVEAENLT